MKQTLSMSRIQHRGYTLIEMLIASVLVAALMSVVWGMMSMYNSYLTAGQSQAVEQQLVRSLLDLMESDLQCVSVIDTNPAIVPSSNDAGDTSAGFDPNQRSMDDPFTDAFAADNTLAESSVLSGLATAESRKSPGQISLTGNSKSLRLSIEKPLPARARSATNPLSVPGAVPGDSEVNAASMQPIENEQNLMEDSASVEGVTPLVEEHQTVIWQFQAPGTTSGTQSLKSGLYRIQTSTMLLQTALSQQESLLEDAASSDESSVDRVTLEALLYPPLDSRSASAESNSVLTAPTFDLVPEVVALQFSYFSGSAWTAAWDSDQQVGLPVAVRVRMRLVSAANLERIQAIFGMTDAPESPLDRDITRTATPQQATTSSDGTESDPLSEIPSRQVERIILLQPLTGPIPQPGLNEDGTSLSDEMTTAEDGR